MTLLVDPPSGWMYGFPKPYDYKTDNYEDMLRQAGYPEKDIPFALEHSRFIGNYDELKAKNEHTRIRTID